MDSPILYKIRPKTEVPSPIFINKHTKRNTDTCYAYGKTEYKHIFHSDDSFQIIEQSQSELVEFFNNYSYFINYDALNEKMFMSVLCGCITIIIPEPNVTKIDWLKKHPPTIIYKKIKWKGIMELLMDLKN